MLFHLVKKDFLLAKKYWIIMLLAAMVLPVFMHTKLDFIAGEFLPFFLSTLYIVFLLYSTVSMMEYKYKGSSLLCATPYTRKTIVMSKYFFVVAIFIGCCSLYTIAALISPVKVGLLDLSEVGRTFLLLSIIFGVMIPVQYRFGYEKSRYIFFFLIFLTPFVLPNIMKLLQQNGAVFPASLPFSLFVLDVLFVLLAFVIGGISMVLSIRIFSNKNL
ncbi:ABC-2 transporter permease [Paenibacillus tyrfis]|uniref:ABC-2 transporter permease n=1 Tax=Paenibacillus tyrfis TaxID=1501230 RepID=UPI0020A01861|nr:ABC-2 transporter permease [Paenibacillus tyrfis]MCP1312665.1 ABC-2 transporter permease [Paenibacillus tyrfis]